MSRNVMSAAEIRRALELRDLTDEAAGPHAVQVLIREVVESLEDAWGCSVRTHREVPIVSVEENYDRLHYPSDGAAREARYTRYLNETTVLRTQTSAMIPAVLRQLSAEELEEELLVCAGLVYRRDSIDRQHTGEPHQADLWRIRDGSPLTADDLREMVELVTSAALPGRPVRTIPSEHPYTTGGMQIDVKAGDEWVEVGECGLALSALLAENGLDPERVSGLAMGLGLDRILMLRKEIEDIRLLRSTDRQVAEQMLDLSPYRSISVRPPARRDLSIAVDGDTTPEELGDRVRGALGTDASRVESVEVLSETPCDELPPAAIHRLGISVGQKNVLVRIVLRDLERTLTHEEANRLRDEVYAAIHRGAVWQWASEAGDGDTEGPRPA
jgi:phenylalanyl-tRNA synthetase alpha chain